MKKYERPVVELNNELAEGVFAASGASGGCDSIYMQGVYSDGVPGGVTYKEKFGCTGCHAYTGQGCKLDDPTFNPKGKILMPNWEQNLHSGDEKFKDE